MGRRSVAGGVAATVVAALAAAAALTASTQTDVLRSVPLPAGERVVALTLDDGPDRVWTPRVLDLLARAGARATFFDVGVRALARPDLVRRELSLGEIGDHTATHRDLLRLDAAAGLAQVVDGAAEIERSGAPRPLLFRPPIGRVGAGLVAAARRRGLRTVLWTVAVERYSDHETPAAAARHVLARIRPGAIVLAHDGGPPGRARTLATLPLVLDGLRRRGYRVVTVTELLALARSGEGGVSHRAGR